MGAMMRRIGRTGDASRLSAGLALVAVLAAALSIAAPATAQDVTWPEIATTEPEKKSLVVRSRYHYREMSYDPAVTVQKAAAPLENNGHPETLLISHVSAMKNLDHDWWLATWDTESQAKIAARDVAEGRTPAMRIEEWAGMQEWGVTLERWIETGQYIIVTYKVWPTGEAATSGEATARELPLALKLFEGRWAATLDLEDDPVFLYFNAGSSEIERVIR